MGTLNSKVETAYLAAALFLFLLGGSGQAIPPFSHEICIGHLEVLARANENLAPTSLNGARSLFGEFTQRFLDGIEPSSHSTANFFLASQTAPNPTKLAQAKFLIQQITDSTGTSGIYRGRRMDAGDGARYLDTVESGIETAQLKGPYWRTLVKRNVGLVAAGLGGGWLGSIGWVFTGAPLYSAWKEGSHFLRHLDFHHRKHNKAVLGFLNDPPEEGWIVSSQSATLESSFEEVFQNATLKPEHYQNQQLHAIDANSGSPVHLVQVAQSYTEGEQTTTEYGVILSFSTAPQPTRIVSVPTRTEELVSP